MADYGLIGKLTASPENRDALADILLEAAALMVEVEGCHLYTISKDADDETAVWVVEVWESEAAHDESLKMPAVRDLIGKAMPLLAGAPEGGTKLTVLGGKGL